MIGLTPQQKLDKEEFLSNFADTWYYQSIIKEYGMNLEFVKTIDEPNEYLPRTRDLKAFMLTEIFWFIDQLVTFKKRTTLFDIGAGHDIFKKILSPRVSVVTVDPYFFEADIRSTFDGDFEEKYHGKIDLAMAINSLHFRPITLFSDILDRYLAIFAAGGRGFITFNISRFIEHTPADQLVSLFGTDNIFVKDAYLAFDYLEQEISVFETRHRDRIDVILVETNRNPKSFNEPMDGNIKIIFDVK